MNLSGGVLFLMRDTNDLKVFISTGHVLLR